MNFKTIILLVFTIALTGCVTSTPEQLFSVPQTKHPGQVKDTGQFPIIGVDPVVPTNQLTPAQEAKLRDELPRLAEKARQQAANNSSGTYESQVEALKRLARERQAALEAQIEADEAAEQ